MRLDLKRNQSLTDRILYNLKQKGNRLTLTPSRFVSTTVDAVYQAMRNNPGLPSRERFVQVLDAKLKAKLGVTFGS